MQPLPLRLLPSLKEALLLRCCTDDPDFLEMSAVHTVAAKRAHFSMWCITSSPLVYSSNLETTNNETLAVLT